MKTRIPKDVHRYIPANVAAAQLINAAIDSILFRDGVMVRWELNLKFHYPPGYEPKPGTLALSMGGKISNGYPEPEDKDDADTGADSEGGQVEEEAATSEG